MKSLTPHRERLRERIITSLRCQGFKLRAGRLVAPDQNDKESLRQLHSDAVSHRIEQARRGLERYETHLLNMIASGSEVSPEQIHPKLIEVQTDTDHELLFRYAKLHWSIPVSAGYGRRLRFIVMDESNGKLMGVFGLADPVFSLGARDRWVGWGHQYKRRRLQCVMDLFVLGAVPPYSELLCGKLIALLATSDEVQRAFRRKYGGKTSCIRRKALDGRLALLTTTSALGRSSLYNRLHYGDEPGFVSVGSTRGSGEFHFGNGFYRDLRKLAVDYCDATAKHTRWGSGFRNRRELLRKVLPLVGLSRELVYHGVERQMFVAPLAENTTAFLRGESQRLHRYSRSVRDVFAWFRERWLLPRAGRTSDYLLFDRASYRIWRKR